MCLVVCSESGFMFLIPVLGAVLAVSVPGATQGEGQSLAVGHWLGWRCQKCPVPTALAAGWVPLSSRTRCILSKEPGSQEGRGGLEQGCWDHVGLKALLPQFRVFVGWLFLLVFFSSEHRRNSGRNISLGFILVFFSKRNLDRKRYVLDKLPMQIT